MLRKIFNWNVGETEEKVKEKAYQYIPNKTRDRLIEEYYQQIPEEEKFFSSIIGYSDIKKLFLRAIRSEHNPSYCMVGSPATAKSIFLQEIERNRPDESTMVDGSGSSGRGLVEALVARPNTKYLLIDEIDKMKRDQVTILYNVLETGRLQQNKKHFIVDQMFEGLRVFEASNSLEKIPKPLRSRLTIVVLPEYTFAEFQEITRRLFTKRYHVGNTVADRVSAAVWHKQHTKDIRRVLAIGKLIEKKDTEQDIDWLIEVHSKHNVGDKQTEWN